MKITRKQLRRLIQEAVYNPVAAMSTAKERIAQKSAEASEESGEEIDYLQSITEGEQLDAGDYIVGERVVTVAKDGSMSYFY